MSTTAFPSRSSGHPEATDRSDRALGYRAVLHNCDCHTFQEVAAQLMKAIRCDFQRGLAIANVVHHTGSATVYQGHRERCEAVAAVLQAIGLRADVIK